MPKNYMAHLSKSATESYKKLRHLYYKFWQNLLQIISKTYCKLWQLKFSQVIDDYHNLH